LIKNSQPVKSVRKPQAAGGGGFLTHTVVFFLVCSFVTLIDYLFADLLHPDSAIPCGDVDIDIVMTVVNTVIVFMMSIEADSLSNVDGMWMVFSAVCPMWAQKSCTVSPPRFLAMCCKRRL